MTTKEKNNVLEQIEKCIYNSDALIKSGNDFVAFITISIGIELLGACHDATDFGDFKLSDKRFKNGLKDFKDIRYKNLGTFLYENLRGPLVHQFRAGNEVELTSISVGKATEKDHFSKALNGKTYLVVECLFEDFVEAFTTFKNHLKKPTNSLNAEKLSENFQVISESNNVVSSGTTKSSAIIRITDLVNPVSKKELRKGKNWK